MIPGNVALRPHWALPGGVLWGRRWTHTRRVRDAPCWGLQCGVGWLLKDQSSRPPDSSGETAWFGPQKRLDFEEERFGPIDQIRIQGVGFKMKRFKIIGLCLVAVFAFSAAMASQASAAISGLYGTCSVGTPVESPPCAAGEKFTAFPFGQEEMVVSHGTTPFLLLNEAGTKGIKCTLLLDEGFIHNGEVSGEMVGLGTEELDYQECKPISLAGCTNINLATSPGLINGIVSQTTVKKGKAVKVTTVSGFNIKCLIGGAETELGNVTGTVEGVPNGSLLEFTKAKGLTFFTEKSNITGSNLTDTLGGVPVVVG